MELDEILEHHGVKGMKWGVRRDHGHEGEKAKTKKIGKLDKQFEKKAATAGTWVKLHNRAAELANSHDIDRINNKPQYKGKDFSKDTPLRRQYYNEHQQAYIKRVQQAAKESGTNASGTRQLKITTDKAGNWGISVVDVKHDAFDELDGTTVPVTYDSAGHIVKVGAPKQTAAQHSEDFVDEFLEHYGVMGMKWGTHRNRGGSSGSAGSGGGGSHHESSHDAAKAEELHTKLKSGGTKALSNQELQHLVNRMNLEQQYSKLNGSGGGNSAAAKGKKMVGEILMGVAKQQATKYLNDQVANALKSAKK